MRSSRRGHDDPNSRSVTTQRRPMHRVRASIVPLGFLLLAAWISYESLQMPLGTLHMPGAGFFPLVLGLLLGVLALLLSAVEGLAAASDDAATLTDRHGVICLAASVLAAALLFERAGFLVTMAAFLTVTTAVLGRIAWWRSAVMAVVGCAAAWVVFVRVLKIALPSGIIPM
jgi:putative tricarboxylic transport membrane protein